MTLPFPPFWLLVWRPQPLGPATGHTGQPSMRKGIEHRDDDMHALQHPKQIIISGITQHFAMTVVVPFNDGLTMSSERGQSITQSTLFSQQIAEQTGS